ncbi:DUF5906 domain-containing protein [Corynebacterium sp. H127]
MKLFHKAHEIDNATVVQHQLFTIDGVPSLRHVQGNEWQLWAGGIWTTVSDRDVERLLAFAVSGRPLIRRVPGTSALESLERAEPNDDKESTWVANAAGIRSLRDALAMTVPTGVEAGKTHERYIVMANGVFDVETQALVGCHSPRYPNAWKLDYDYQPGATCPHFDAYIEHACKGQPNTLLFLQEYMGYIARGRTDLQKGLYLMGESGAGQSVYEKVCTMVVGAGNKVSADGDTGKHTTSSWVGKKLISFADMRSVHDPRKFAELLLKVTGQDDIVVEPKYGNRKTVRIDANVIICTNTVLPLLDVSGVAPTRFMGVFFRQKVRGTALEDSALPEKIAEEMPGVFNWAMVGLQRLQRQGHFTVPDTHDMVLDRLKAAALATFDFYDEALRITGEPCDVLATHDVRAALLDWARNTDSRIASGEKSLDGIESYLERLGLDISKPKGMWQGKREQPRCISGCQFTSSFERYRTEKSVIAERIRNDQARRDKPQPRDAGEPLAADTPVELAPRQGQPVLF